MAQQVVLCAFVGYVSQRAVISRFTAGGFAGHFRLLFAAAIDYFHVGASIAER